MLKVYEVKLAKDLNNIKQPYLTLNNGENMVLKTFNVQEEVYGKFSHFCKEHGISMSRQIELFMESMIDDDPEAKEEYLKKLDKIRQQRTIHVGSLEDFKKRYGLE